MIDNQLISLKAPPFYNSHCFKLNKSASPFKKAQPTNQKMASRLGSCKAISAVALGSCSCKGAVGSVHPTSKSESKSDEFAGPEKGTPTSSHTSTPAPISVSASAPILAESIPALKCSKMDLIRILKIFSKTKSQEPKPEVARTQSLKAKVHDLYLEKLHMDCYHFCQ